MSQTGRFYFQNMPWILYSIIKRQLADRNANKCKIARTARSPASAIYTITITRRRNQQQSKPAWWIWMSWMFSRRRQSFASTNSPKRGRKKSSTTSGKKKSKSVVVDKRFSWSWNSRLLAPALGTGARDNSPHVNTSYVSNSGSGVGPTSRASPTSCNKALTFILCMELFQLISFTCYGALAKKTWLESRANPDTLSINKW